MKVLEELEELEKDINSRLKGADFKFPPKYLAMSLVKLGEPKRVGADWYISFSKNFIEESMNLLKVNCGVEDLVPFAKKEDSVYRACFGTVGKDKGRIIIVSPFALSKETMIMGKYKSFEYWLERLKKYRK